MQRQLQRQPEQKQHRWQRVRKQPEQKLRKRQRHQMQQPGAGLSPQAVKAKAVIKAANTDVFFMVGSFIKLKGSVYYSK